MGIMMNSYQFLSTRTDIRMEPPVRYRSDHGQRIFYRMAHGLVLGRMRRIESLRHQPRKHSRMDMYVLQPAPPPPAVGLGGGVAHQGHAVPLVHRDRSIYGKRLGDLMQAMSLIIKR